MAVISLLISFFAPGLEAPHLMWVSVTMGLLTTIYALIFTAMKNDEERHKGRN